MQRPIADALVDEEFPGIAETLASVPDIDDLPDRESLAAVFRHLDVNPVPGRWTRKTWHTACA